MAAVAGRLNVVALAVVVFSGEAAEMIEIDVKTGRPNTEPSNRDRVVHFWRVRVFTRGIFFVGKEAGKHR